MRALINALLILCLLSLAFAVFSYFHEKTVTLSLPPDSLKQWYKPTNERHVWLHNMFKLRREMQAISEHAANGDQTHVLKWTQKLVQDYKKAGEMVPEWKKRMKPHLVDELLAAVQKNDIEEVKRTQHEIGRICKQCHNKYQVITATIYRSADFSEIKIVDSYSNEPLHSIDTMENLSIAMNRIIISMADMNIDRALSSSVELEKRLNDLTQICSSCHKDEAAKETILGAATKAHFKKLRKHLGSRHMTKAGQTVGEIAVTTCARCHSIHRIASDMRKDLIN